MNLGARDLILSVDRNDRLEKRYGLYMLAGDDEFSDLGRAVETEVFGEFFGNGADEMAEEYGPYDAASTFITLVDHETEEAAGVIRVLRESPAGLKSIHDFANIDGWQVSIPDIERYHNFDYAPVAMGDIATLAVRSKYRRTTSGVFVSMGLYHGLYWESIHAGYERWFGVLDKVVFDLLRSMGVAFEAVCGLPPVHYLGSPESLPVTLDTDAVRRHMRTLNAPSAEMMIDGVGVHDFVSFPDIILESTSTRADLVIDLREAAEARTSRPATSDR